MCASMVFILQEHVQLYFYTDKCREPVVTNMHLEYLLLHMLDTQWQWIATAGISDALDSTVQPEYKY